MLTQDQALDKLRTLPTEEAAQIYSDAHKDVIGFRPRHFPSNETLVSFYQDYFVWKDGCWCPKDHYQSNPDADYREVT